MLTQSLCSAFIAALLAVSGTHATPTSSRSAYTVKEYHNVPRKWSNVGPAPEDHIINLQIALKQCKFDELERHLYEGTLQPLFKPVKLFAASDMEME
jgi:tripeptidyl-peptidase-1